jgi:hypothetical protein
MDMDTKPGDGAGHELAHWTAEFVYGTISVLIAIAGVEVAGIGTPTGTGLIVFVGAAATWAAHAYAASLGRHHVLRRPPTWEEIKEDVIRAWPIMLAAVPAVIAIGLSTLGWWDLRAAIGFANLFGLAVLAWCGWAAGNAAGGGTSTVIRSVLITTTIGLVIIGVETVLHH